MRTSFWFAFFSPVGCSILVYWVTEAIQKSVHLKCVVGNYRKLEQMSFFWNDANTQTFHYPDVTKMQLLLSHSH